MSAWRRVFVAALLLLPACGERDSAMQVGAHAGLACTTCHASVSDEVVGPLNLGACGDCHAPGETADTVVLANVSLSHAHPARLSEGTADCSACHAHDAGDAPITTGSGSCFACHADLVPAGATATVATVAESECRECHVQPEHTAFLTSGAPVDHALVLARGISCTLCHYDVVEGNGAVPPSACRDCHGRLGGPAPVTGAAEADAAVLHATHLEGDVRLGCGRCHTPVEHRVVKLASALALDCAGCHAADDPVLRADVDSAAHIAEQQLYAGLSPTHPTVPPAVKFLERVGCNACHDVASTRATGADAMRRINAMCVDCHGPRFGTLLAPWLAGLRAHTRAVSTFVHGVSAGAGRGADSLLASATAALRLVEAGHGVHNVAGADSLLRIALSAARRAAGPDRPAAPAIGPSPGRESCVRCHYGVDTDPATSGAPFNHGRHILAGGLQCAACHGTADFFLADGRTFDPAHGSVHVDRADCMTCHHVEPPRDCAACHAPVEVEAVRAMRPVEVHVRHGNVTNRRDVPFDHAVHGDFACASCHVAASIERTAIACGDCHDRHHAEASSPAGCTQCHSTGVREVHDRVDHLSCGACHTTETLRLLGEADRAFCLQCHVRLADHEPGGECASCHLQVAPAEAMQRILSADVPPRMPDGVP